MNKVFVEYDMFCNYSEHSHEEFGSWHEEYIFSVCRTTLKEDVDRYRKEEFADNNELKKGDTAYVLYATYNTGDSCGLANGKGECEVLWVFKDYALAIEVSEKLKKSFDSKEDYVHFVTETGQEVKIGNPASRYFEDSGSAYVEFNKE